MKTTSYILSFFILCSCKSKNTAALKDTTSNTSTTVTETLKKERPKVKITPYKIYDDYTVIDTGEYSNEGPMTGGSYAIIKNNREVVDTIDLYYGMKELGNKTYFYHKLEHEMGSTEGDSKKTLMLQEGNFFLITNNKKTAFDNLTSSFDDYFSSPNVINQKIYFWKLEKIDTVGTLKVSATEFDPFTRKTQSYFLLNDVLETDDSNYFPLPYIKNDTIYFDAGKDKLMKFSKDFKAYN
ncbi:hypothetical protein [Mucilaginibacter sp.]|jgi:hypothetical protein|uniref:hypothetical protein n=1 Tax=Mucilaginibacter sp. TaxID=1882438 RepID=UPI002601EF84|nr:hypothetical protein [Mucilaginibacter sp.]MDB4918751.1 hypothetical protein [Mucilaginibacter sp.]